MLQEETGAVVLEVHAGGHQLYHAAMRPQVHIPTTYVPTPHVICCPGVAATNVDKTGNQQMRGD